jgi:nitrilase
MQPVDGRAVEEVELRSRRKGGSLPIAVIQHAPVFLDLDATVEKACALIAQAGTAGARLVVFPEAFVPCFPFWVTALSPGERGTLGDLYAELMANAVTSLVLRRTG